MSAIGKVLVIDDDLAVRLRIGDLLDRAGGFVMHEACDGPTGLASARMIEPDLILLDIMMPGMTGYEVCAALRADALFREIPIIVLSAAEESEAMIAALDAGADDFLRKPFSAPELMAKVRTITRLNRFRSLAGERDRLRWLLDHSLEALIIADERGDLVYANRGAQAIFGLPAQPGTDVAAAISRHFQVQPSEAWAAWRELRLAPGGPFTIFQPETERTSARWFDVELHEFNGATPQTLLKFTDRSAAVRRDLETFTFQHLISHKIRTPLNGLSPIFTFLEASDGTHVDPDTADLLQLARDSAERLERTLTGILDYHAAVFAPRRIEPDGAREPLSQVIRRAADAAMLHDKVVLTPADAHVAQPEVIEIVLTEILENYAKFSSAPCAGVVVTLVQESGLWALRLFAPGPGLPPDIVAQLGRPYVQVERKFSGEVPGMGLGLATVRLLLRSRGGDILFANHPEEPGLVTTIHLPPEALRFDGVESGNS